MKTVALRGSSRTQAAAAMSGKRARGGRSLTLAGSGAAWSFVPSATNVGVAWAQEDADHVDFGCWVEHDMTRAGDPHTVDAFFKGEDSLDAVGSCR